MSHRFAIRILFIAATSLVAALPACGSIFKSYPSQLDSIYQYYRAGDFATAASEITSEDYSSKKDGPDDIIWLLEEGKLLHAAGRFDESNEAFTRCEKKIEAMENRPSVSVRDALEEVAAAGTNTNAIPYKANPAEKILVNVYKSLNYLCLSNLESALVEVRRADFNQTEALKTYAAEVNEARAGADDTARKRSLNLSGVVSNSTNQGRIQNLYRDLDSVATPAYAKFANPAASYISAICHLMEGSADDARIDLERVAAMVPENRSVANDLELLATGGTAAFRNSVFILFENGVGPRREETRIDLIVPVPGYLTYIGFAFPSVRFGPSNNAALHIKGTGIQSATERLASLDAIVAFEFKQQLPSMIARIVVSTLVKAGMANVNKKQGGLADAVTRIVVGLWSAIVNNADLRTWMTLGREFQCTRISAPPGSLITIEMTGAAPITITPGAAPYHVVVARSVREGHLVVHSADIGGAAPAGLP